MSQGSTIARACTATGAKTTPTMRAASPSSVAQPPSWCDRGPTPGPRSTSCTRTTGRPRSSGSPRTPVVFTIHNLAHQGIFDPSILPSVGIGPELFTPDKLEFYGKVNFLKGGLIAADHLTTVSATYAREIQT